MSILAASALDLLRIERRPGCFSQRRSDQYNEAIMRYVMHDNQKKAQNGYRFRETGRGGDYEDMQFNNCVGKKAEFGVRRYLWQWLGVLYEVDLTQHTVRSYNPDLGGIYHVKGCLKERWRTGWTFTKEIGLKVKTKGDPILRNHYFGNEKAVFVRLGTRWQGAVYNIEATVNACYVNVYQEEPRLENKKETKKAVYLDDLKADAHWLNGADFNFAILIKDPWDTVGEWEPGLPLCHVARQDGDTWRWHVGQRGPLLTDIPQGIPDPRKAIVNCARTRPLTRRATKRPEGMEPIAMEKPLWVLEAQLVVLE